MTCKRKTRAGDGEPSPWAIGALALGLLMAVTGATGEEIFYSVDAAAMFHTARALLETGEPDVTSIVRVPVIWGSSRARFLHASPHGLLYMKYNLGQPLLALPLLGLGKAAASLISPHAEASYKLIVFMYFMLPVLAMAATCALLYVFARELWGSRAALWISGLLLLTTPAGPYGKYPFAEASLALCYLSAYLLIFRGGRDRGLAGWYGFLSGVFSGWSVFIREGAIAGLPAILLYIRLRGPEGTAGWRMLRGWGIGTALPILAAAGYNFLRFGNPFQTGYFHEMDRLAHPLGIGWFGLLLSPGKGLFLYAPSVLVSLLSWPAFWKVRRSEAAAIGLHALGYLVLYGTWWAWHGGWAWGPRFLVPLLPLLLLGLGTALRCPAGRWAVRISGLLGLAVQIPGFAVDFQKYYAALYIERGTLFEEDLIFRPAFSPIVGQWKMLLRGEGLALTLFSFESTGIPIPISMGYRALVVGLLLGGLRGLCLPAKASAAATSPEKPSGSPSGFPLWMRKWIAGWLLLVLLGLNIRIWLTGISQVLQPFCHEPSCQPLHVRFSNGLELLAWSLPSPVAQPGGTLRMRLWWRAAEPIREPLSVYVHFQRRDQLIFQGDHEHPAFLPLPEWIPGWIYPDPYEIQVPMGIPSGEYQIRLGLYRRHPPGGRIPTQSGEDGIWLPQPVWVLSEP